MMTKTGQALFPLLLLCSLSAPAQDGASVVNRTDDLPQQLKKILPQTCTNCEPACSSLSDDFCKALWSGKNRGNYQEPEGGSILRGETPTHVMTMAKRADLEAFVQAVQNNDTSPSALPPEVKAKLAPVAARLKDALANESPSRSWFRGLSEMLLEIKDTLKSAGDDAVYKQHPELKGIAFSDLTPAQRILLHDGEQAMLDQMVRAKYENTPNWKGVKDVYDQVVKDLTNEISHFKIKDSEKAKMLQALTSVNLVLPYGNVHTYTADEDCAYSEDDAAYSAKPNAFSICAGKFNTYFEPAHLYATIAHELTHSFDTIKFREVEFEETPVGKVAKTLCRAKGPAYSCDEWNHLKAAVLVQPTTVPLNSDGLTGLSKCLSSTDDLAPWSQSKLGIAATSEVRDSMDFHARQNDFTTVAQPIMQMPDGARVPNDLYMRPDLIREADRISVEDVTEETGKAPNSAGWLTDEECETASGLELFTQELSCSRLHGKPVPDLKALSDEDRATVFTAARKESVTLQEAIEKHWFSFCGRDCEEDSLVNLNLSRPNHEATADWLANKAFGDYYLPRLGSLEAKRQAAGSMDADMCDPPSPTSLAPLLLKSEQEVNKDPHPEDRVRRMNVFTPDVIAQVKCRPDADTKVETAKCDL